MNQVSDQEFNEWLDAIEKKADMPSSLPEGDAADLKLAQRLFDLRLDPPQAIFHNRRVFQSPLLGRRRQWVGRLVAAATLGILLLAIAISSSGTVRAQILRSLGLNDDVPWVSPVPVMFEGKRYEPEAFDRLVQERLQEVDLVLVPDEDENGQPILYAFRTPEEARLFLEQTRGVPPNIDGSDEN